MSNTTYATTPSRAVLGLLAGAVAAGGVWTALYVLMVLSFSWNALDPSELATMGAGSWALYSAIYLVGLAIFGAPVWAIMHLAHRRRASDAIIAGIATSCAVIMGITLLIAPTGYMTWVVLLPMVSVVGAPVGWVIWRVAYRRTV